MKTLKGKKSTVSKKNDIVFSKYKPSDSYFKFAILAYRLKQCINSIRIHNENSKVPSQNDSSFFVTNELSNANFEKELIAYLDGEELRPSAPVNDKILELIRDCTNAALSQIGILKSMDKSERNHINSIHRYVFKNIIQKGDISDEQSLQSLCDACCLLSLPQHDPGAQISDNDIKEVLNIEQLLITKVGEALGYWTNKLPRKINADKGNKTKQQQREMKEKYITEEWVRMINKPEDRKLLENLSLNEIALRIQIRVEPELRNIKTQTKKYVLTRTKKINKEGSIAVSGLSTDTIIDIMRNTTSDRFTFNPFKK
ncbi:MAG: hypothetical protein KBG22_11770 [Smithella sp.]|nr:hypothetical protein [Smithella sp.]